MGRAIRIALRVLRQERRLWAVVGLVSAASGVTAATAALYYCILLAPLRTPEPERVISMGSLAYGSLTDPVAWWGQAEGLEAIALYRVGDVTSSVGQDEQWRRVAEVSPGFLPSLGVRPLVGRDFTADDAGQRVAIIGADIWRQEFGGAPDVVDRTVDIGGIRHRVIGVMPPTVRFPARTQLWTARQARETDRLLLLEGSPSSLVPIRTPIGWIGRLRPGVSVDQVRAQLTALVERANRELSPVTRVRYGDRAAASLMTVSLSRSSRQMVLLLTITSLSLWLLSGVNCALYLIARQSARADELAMRIALGASRRQIQWLQFTEAGAIGVIAGIAASAISLGGVRLAVHVLPAAASFWVPTTAVISGMLVGAAAGGVLAGMLAGAISVIFGARRPLRAGVGLRSRSHAMQRRGRQALIAFQLAAATVLMAGAMSGAAQLVAWRPSDPGFEPEYVLTAMVGMPRIRTEKGFELPLQLVDDILAAARIIPSVTAAALSFEVTATAARRQFHALAAGDQHLLPAVATVTPDYFETFGIPMLAGRPAERIDEVVVNTALAQALWPGEAATGKTVKVRDRPVLVTGVVANTHLAGDSARPLEFYRPFQPGTSPLPHPPMRLSVRCAKACGDVARLLGELNGRSGLIVARVDAVEELIAAESQPLFARAIVTAVFAGIGIVIALLGLYAFVSHSVARRASEAGIRLSLGASPRRVARTLAVDGLAAVAAGAAIGTAVLPLVFKLLRGIVFGGPALSPSVVLLAAGVTVAVGAAACLVPSWTLASKAPLQLINNRV